MSAPQDVIAEFLRAKFGRPSPEVERVIEAFAALADRGGAVSSPAPDDLADRLAAIEDRLTKLEAAAETPAASSDVHRRLAALEAAATRPAPARAAAPAAKPAAASA